MLMDLTRKNWEVLDGYLLELITTIWIFPKIMETKSNLMVDNHLSYQNN